MPCYDISLAAEAADQGKPWTVRLASDKHRQFWEARSAGADLATIRYGSTDSEGKILEKTFDFQKIQREVKLKLSKGYTYVEWTRQELDLSEAPAPLSGPFAEATYIRTVKDTYTGEVSYFAVSSKHEVLIELAREGADDLRKTYRIADEDPQWFAYALSEISEEENNDEL
jgi:predicted DNA-binding WGR domain protein